MEMRHLTEFYLTKQVYVNSPKISRLKLRLGCKCSDESSSLLLSTHTSDELSGSGYNSLSENVSERSGNSCIRSNQWPVFKLICAANDILSSTVDRFKTSSVFLCCNFSSSLSSRSNVEIGIARYFLYRFLSVRRW